MPFFTFNQTRLVYEGKEGKEPDVAYSFGKDKEMPDLAVEVNITSSSINDLTKYQYLAIPEVWIWSQESIKLFVKVEQGYLNVAVSNCLPNLKSDLVTDVVNSSFGKSPLEIEKLLNQQ
ncbi:MAG: Uma2 family endonuclease [Cyanobacteria bacterium P01_C01_bin.72]